MAKVVNKEGSRKGRSALLISADMLIAIIHLVEAKLRIILKASRVAAPDE
ncbi:hypothetical protein NYV40_16635 [Escherichia coli]|nr:hypothetical protein [Escherichia coli]